MPDPPYRNFASQFILSSRRISTETWNIHPERTIRRLEEFRDPLLLPSFSFSFFKLEIYIYIYIERGEEGWNLIGSFDTDLTDAGTAAIR